MDCLCGVLVKLYCEKSRVLLPCQPCRYNSFLMACYTWLLRARANILQQHNRFFLTVFRGMPVVLFNVMRKISFDSTFQFRVSLRSIERWRLSFLSSFYHTVYEIYIVWYGIFKSCFICAVVLCLMHIACIIAKHSRIFRYDFHPLQSSCAPCLPAYTRRSKCQRQLF